MRRRKEAEAEAETRLVIRGNAEATAMQAIMETLRKPADLAAIDLDEMTDAEFDLYVSAACTAISALLNNATGKRYAAHKIKTRPSGDRKTRQ